MSLFVLSQILGLFLKRLIADDIYSLLNRKNLLEPIRMQLSQKHQFFCQFFATFLIFTLNLKHFQEKMALIGFIFSKLGTTKDVVRQMSKKSRFRTLFDSHYDKGTKTPWKFARKQFYRIF